MLPTITYHATLSCIPDNQHPDYQYMTTQQKSGLNFNDNYTFSIYDPIENPTGYYTTDQTDDMIARMKHDLMLVAGGGYNTDHIHNVKFTYERIA